MSMSDISSAPPIVADEQPPKPVVWPKVLGIIFIIFGVLGIMQGCFGVLSLLIFGAFSEFVPEEQAQMMSSMDSFKPWMITAGASAFFLAVTLLVAGIGVVSRKIWSRKTVLFWAGIKMAFVIFNSLLSYMVQQAQFQAMQEMMENDPNAAAAMPMFSSIMMWMGVFMIFVSIIWGWALPVFTLIWFARRKIRSEVSSWGGDSVNHER